MDEMNPDQERAMAVIEPIMHEIFPIFPDALKTYNEKYPAEVKAQHEGRTAAGCVRDHAWTEFKSLFMDRSGFNFLEIRGLHVLNIEDKLVIRIKKVDENGVHSNYQTAQQKDFDRQVDLPGLPAAASRVVIGYQPDIAFSVVERIIVRSPSQKWVSQIMQVDEVATWVDITPAELPFRSTGRNATG